MSLDPGKPVLGCAAAFLCQHGLWQWCWGRGLLRTVLWHPASRWGRQQGHEQSHRLVFLKRGAL